MTRIKRFVLFNLGRIIVRVSDWVIRASVPAWGWLYEYGGPSAFADAFNRHARGSGVKATLVTSPSSTDAKIVSKIAKAIGGGYDN